MAYVDHLTIKPQVLLPGFAEGLKDAILVSQLVTKRDDVDRYFLAEGDTISQRIRGTVPVRHYALRNDRSQPIVTDTYKETVVSIKLEAERAYSAVKLTDEQLMWDFQDGWGELLLAQAETLGGYFEHSLLQKIVHAPYERVVVVQDDAQGLSDAKNADQDVWFNAVVEATKALKLMRVPMGEQLFALCGVNVGSEIRKSNKLRKDQGLGSAALEQANLGTIAGVQFVENTHLSADECYIFARSANVLYTAAPPIPQSVPYGNAASVGGFAIRHILDYDTAHLTDRSVFDSLFGSNYTLDLISATTKTGNFVTSNERVFVRGVKIVRKSLGGVDKKPGDGKTDTPGGNPASYLAKAYANIEIDDPASTAEAWPVTQVTGQKITATATVTVANGAVTGFVVNGMGLGYTSTPTVTITGAGTGATAVATIENGMVTGVFVTAGGTGYTGTTTVAIAAP